MFIDLGTQMKSLGLGSTIQSSALTIKQYVQIHGDLPKGLFVNLLFLPIKFPAWGLILEDRIKISIPDNNPMAQVFTDWKYNDFIGIFPLYVQFDQDTIGTYELFAASDEFKVNNIQFLGGSAIKWETVPINPGDVLGGNPDRKRKNTAR